MNPHLQIIISNQDNPYWNLAVEDFLLNQNLHNTVTMYLWKNRQTVVIGLNQNPYNECNVDKLIAEGGFLARRKTGGGAVFHDLGNINFSFIADKDHYNVTKQLNVIQTALQHYGLSTEISGRNDLTFEGRKFSGNAFSKGKFQNLHHGTILIKTDVDKIQQYLTIKPAKLAKHGVQSVASRIINLSEVADITSDNIIRHLTDAFQQIYQGECQVIDFDNIIQKEETQILQQFFADEEFLYGKWKNFSTKISQQFPWGHVEIDIDIDESQHCIRNIEIATDCLQLQAVKTAKELLTNANSTIAPDIPDIEDKLIIEDIFHLIY
jgi:lipoate-protein ligase A